MGDSSEQTLAASWESEVPGIAGYGSEPPPPSVLEDEAHDHASCGPVPGPMTQIGTLPGSLGSPLRFMMGSASGMMIGDRPLNTMRVRRDRASAARARLAAPSETMRPALRQELPLLRRASRFRGISPDEFEGGWL